MPRILLRSRLLGGDPDQRLWRIGTRFDCHFGNHGLKWVTGLRWQESALGYGTRIRPRFLRTTDPKAIEPMASSARVSASGTSASDVILSRTAVPFVIFSGSKKNCISPGFGSPRSPV